MASTPFSHSQTVRFGRTPPQTMWEIMTQGQGVPAQQVLRVVHCSAWHFARGVAFVELAPWRELACAYTRCVCWCVVLCPARSSMGGGRHTQAAVVQRRGGGVGRVTTPDFCYLIVFGCHGHSSFVLHQQTVKQCCICPAVLGRTCNSQHCQQPPRQQRCRASASL